VTCVFLYNRCDLENELSYVETCRSCRHVSCCLSVVVVWLITIFVNYSNLTQQAITYKAHYFIQTTLIPKTGVPVVKLRDWSWNFKYFQWFLSSKMYKTTTRHIKLDNPLFFRRVILTRSHSFLAFAILTSFPSPSPTPLLSSPPHCCQVLRFYYINFC